LTTNFNLTDAPRQDQLRAWIFLYGPSFSAMAREMGITPKAVIDLCKAETAPPPRVEQLKALGLPENLLPEGRYTPPGPSGKRERAS
jgi:hypothetical protein